MSERLAGMPRSWGRNPTAVSRFRQSGAPFWILAVTVAVFAIATAVVLVRIPVVLGAVAPFFVLGLVAWVIWAVVAAWLLGLADVYRHVPWSISLALIAWAALVATQVSGLLEGVVPPILGSGYTTAVTAGLFEEALKLLGVVLVAAIVPVLFRRPMGGLICGMMAGVGFSLAENVGDTMVPLIQQGPNAGATQNALTVLTVFGVRGFVDGAAAHMVFTGLTSMGVFYVVSRAYRGLGRPWGVAVGLFLAAVLMHTVNDMPIMANSLAGEVFNTVLQIAVLVGLIVYAVTAERRWFTSAATGAAPVIQSDETDTLRSHRSRRQARGQVSDRAARQRMATMQWAQIGYLDAVVEGAPEAQIERLASYVARLRSPASTGRVPGPRRPAPSDERMPRTDAPG